MKRNWFINLAWRNAKKKLITSDYRESFKKKQEKRKKIETTKVIREKIQNSRCEKQNEFRKWLNKRLGQTWKNNRVKHEKLRRKKFSKSVLGTKQNSFGEYRHSFWNVGKKWNGNSLTRTFFGGVQEKNVIWQHLSRDDNWVEGEGSERQTREMLTAVVASFLFLCSRR